ncbi:MAG TPA: outer membrane beta-barrel protein [Dinghuibacter sp.]|uniref:outer membrane beta-barrel protein n=1 Tax=Dinghuibacter sp. TaxID=2024697 RepID=UPI002C73550D|nr:outer membrane beta-barrel protein [Dinghuibacter sp.]HTJ13013.1 outer membrane beta-barrel protein [Dinghuibacter sp.]
MRKMLLLAGLLPLTAAAQHVSGRVVDTLDRHGLPFATVSLVSAVDSTLVTFAVADSTGRFNLTAIGRGPFLLSASYAGYAPLWKRLSSGEQTLCLTSLSHLRDITINAPRPPVEINNDTLEFNTENFKTQPNAVVEDLLRKMPGVTVESDGTVKVNGQTVRRVLVNGKEFFTGDIKMATKNLSADAVDKVQVFDRKSDQASFTGIDDGNSEKTINLKLKKDRNNALFGKITGGAGDQGRYDAQANVNRFSGDKQLSFLGMGNNTNRQGFSLMDVLNFTGQLSRGLRNGGGAIQISTGTGGNSGSGLPVTGLGQSQQGVAATLAGGVNYNNTWNGGKTSVSTSYAASHVRLATDQATYSQNLFPGNEYNTVDTTHTINDVTQHRFNLALDQQVDSSFSLRFTPVLTWQDNHKDQNERYNSLDMDGQPLNNGYNHTSPNSDAFDAEGTLLLRKRLRKKGRTFSANIDLAYNHSTLSGKQLSGDTLYTSGQPPLDSAIDQATSRNAHTYSIGGNVTYTEPVGKRSLASLSGFVNTNVGHSVKQTYNNDVVFDSLLSNDFTSRYTYSGGTLNFRGNRRHASFTLGATLQTAGLNALDNTSGRDIRQSFTDLLPSGLFQYQFTQTRNLRLEYNTYTTQPTIAQLQPVPDLTDPLAVTTGNPSLKRSYTHSVSLNMVSASPAQRRNLFAFLTFSETLNAMVQSDSVTPYGTRISRPVNAPGSTALTADVDYGWPLRKLLSQVDAGSGLTYSQGLSYINGNRNRITSLNLGPNLSYSFNPNKRNSVTLSANVSLNIAQYSLEPALNTDYIRQNYGVDLIDDLPLGISLHNNFNYIVNTGRIGSYNINIPLWNSSVSKYVFKNDRGELRLSLMDALGRNTGITRNVDQTAIQDERYNVLQRYILLSFTYSLNKSGLKTGGGTNVRVRTFGH